MIMIGNENVCRCNEIEQMKMIIEKSNNYEIK